MLLLPGVINVVLVLASFCVAASDIYPPQPLDLTTPVQQRIAIFGPNKISVGWNTYQHLSRPCVQYGLASDALIQKACSNASETYSTCRTWFNTVVMDGLTPAATYYYKIVSTNSSIHHFVSPRESGDATPFAMDVVIDLGVYGTDGFTTSKRDAIPKIEPALNHSTIGRLADTTDDYELIIHPGDFAYADNWYDKHQNRHHGEAAYQSILEQFYQQLAPIAGRKAYMASPGNHEATCDITHHVRDDCPSGQTNFTDFMHRFGATLPTAFPSSSSNATAMARSLAAQKLARPPFWYSFEYGMAHIVMIDTETDFPKAPDGIGGSTGDDGGPFGSPSQQTDFIEADLASVDRTVTPWLVVAGHRPWYKTGGGEACRPCQKAFEPLLYRYGVDLAVFGHVHNSQRLVPIHNGTPDPNGMRDPKAPMYIVAGGAGNIEGLRPIGKNVSYNAFAYADDFSFAKVSFKDRRHLQVDFIRSRTGEVLDTSVLYKEHAEQFTVLDGMPRSGSVGSRAMARLEIVALAALGIVIL
ncbi:Purple acid phosphatase-lik [Metarhizium album ARSEF 1941]|uniref:Purple acid phosphatase n=1 Tax=Metarhizium album (strain ARSEF 1941) TaxID=1081103 RepID=A0A0B2WSA1_METAS|nr:Purple acid phosphatase-lik [Metarhizium album ARSEF 1941]KHN96903.1 Purple acid phosphatase-lik [Metarhizium album ARSEF 1941]